MSGTSEPSVHRLRDRAQRALEGGRPRKELLSLLDRLVTAAPDGSDDSLFAHRQLAELRLEDHPWRAALHLRRLVAAGAADDGVHALLGLCHALLGNLRLAIASYRDALRLSPRNPWYHHNIGHLLDVGLDQPRRAIEHLRTASRLVPDEDEVTASLAHCLARAGELVEACALANSAVEAAPRNVEHRSLLAWIERGAPSGERAVRKGGADAHSDVTLRRVNATAAIGSASAPSEDDVESVSRAFAARMVVAGFTDEQVMLASSLWTDFSSGRELRMQKPEALAGAVELAFAWVHGLAHVNPTEVARRYGVTKSSLTQRYREIRSVLKLVPHDPRY